MELSVICNRIHESIDNGDVSALNTHLELLEQSPNIETCLTARIPYGRNQLQFTALKLAVYKGHSECVSLLFQAFDPEPQIIETMDDNFTVLMIAACHGYSECVRLLLDAYDPHRQLTEYRSSDLTAVKLAIINQHIDCVRVMLSVMNDDQIRSAVFHAGQYRRTKIMVLLLRFVCQIDLNTSTNMWKGALRDALSHFCDDDVDNNPDDSEWRLCVELLVRMGAEWPILQVQKMLVLEPVLRGLLDEATLPATLQEALLGR